MARGGRARGARLRAAWHREAARARLCTFASLLPLVALATSGCGGGGSFHAAEARLALEQATGVTLTPAAIPAAGRALVYWNGSTAVTDHQYVVVAVLVHRSDLPAMRRAIVAAGGDDANDSRIYTRRNVLVVYASADGQSDRTYYVTRALQRL